MLIKSKGRMLEPLTRTLKAKPVNETEEWKRCMGAEDKRVLRTNILGENMFFISRNLACTPSYIFTCLNVLNMNMNNKKNSQCHKI